MDGFKIRKKRNQNLYCVYFHDGSLHSTHPTRRLAKQSIMGGAKETLSNEEKEDAKTYSLLLQNSYKDAKNQIKNINGYIRDDELSGNRFQVYYNPNTHHTYVIHRGTNKSSIADWKNNLAYAIDLYEHTPRYKFALEQQKKAEQKYGSENITTTGHSQGALLASKVGQKTRKIVAYQKPVGFNELLQSPPKNEIDIRTSNDLVSILNPFQVGSKVYTIPSKTSNIFYEHTSKPLQEHVGAGRRKKKVHYNI